MDARLGGEMYIPQLSVDCVIFGFHDHQLKVLLLKPRKYDFWTLPGGLVAQTEGVDEAAQRVLRERTSLTDIYLEQFRVFGDAGRATIDTMKKFLENNDLDVADFSWLLKRYVSVGYYALVDFSVIKPVTDRFSEMYEWCDVRQLPEMGFDHREIAEKALETLQLMLDHKLVGFNLLSETFTMNELQSLYETILNTPFRRNNFQRKMLNLGILERVEKLYTGAANKAPYLYKFKAGPASGN
ncbi:NUDIX domain-containing protein [Emticicia sp. CRIBPO]|nr:NUDIX domain-containing protein [Emticicia sp. CRIBPO]